MGRRNIFCWAGLFFVAVLAVASAAGTTGCGKGAKGRRIVRIALGQSESHPEYLGLVAFKEYVEENLGDTYEVQIFPNEILGATQRAIELTQTGAIDFVVAGTANLETFADVYEIFSMPYLFDSPEAYREFMSDEEMMNGIYESTDRAGFRVLTWYNAGTRNFYAKKPIYTPEDLRGMKIRVQQSPASVKMMQAFGAAASPMSFGEVYTAIQQGVIDGAENNELALTNNKHGEVAKYFTYNMHQMVPDMLVGNLKFLESLTPRELEVFKEAARRSGEAELEEWDRQVEQAKKTAAEDMGVEFLEADVEAFREKVLPLHQEMLAANPDIVQVYERVREVNERMREKDVQYGPEMGSRGPADGDEDVPTAGNGEPEGIKPEDGNRRGLLAVKTAWETVMEAAGRETDKADGEKTDREAAGSEIPAAAYRVIPRSDRIFQRESKPQSAMEAGLGMRWRTGWEFADDEGERTWTE